MNQKHNKYAVVYAIIGSSLEFYDFIIYILISPYMIGTFFNNLQDKNLQIAQSLAIFATGYFARPLGGVIFGTLGDKLGRKNVFLSSMLLMAISTFGIGILPGYQFLGFISPSILLLLRVMQGISFGGELPGAITYISEFSSKESKIFNLTMLNFGLGFGIIIASSYMYFFSLWTHKNWIYDWGWRVPFLFGGILAIIGYFIRKKLAETPQFLEILYLKKSINNFPLSQLIKEHKRNIFYGIIILLLPSSIVIFKHYIPLFFNNYYHYDLQKIYFFITFGVCWAMLISPFIGHLYSYFNNVVIFLINMILFLMVNVLLLTAGQINILNWSIFSIFMYETFYILFCGFIFNIVSQLFPTEIRFTGIGVCYNGAYCFASLIPLASTLLVKYFNNPGSIFILLSIIGIMSFCSLIIIYQKRLCLL